MSAGNNGSSGVQLCEELLELATPDLYRNNLFRVLCVPVHAGPAEVRQRQKKLEMQRKLGLSAESSFIGLFPLTPPPSPETAAKAIERMNDPVSRFLDEFFWFSAPADDAGLAALERGNVVEARNHWKRQVSDPAAIVHAQHNLAVMDHLLVLEHPSPDVRASAALAAWKATLANEAFWDHVRARVGEMNDVRLTTGFVRRLRDTLPRMKLLIFARQAIAASEQGDAKKTAALLKVIRESGYGSEIVDETVREALKPLRNRISAAVVSSKQHWTKTPQHGDKIVRELHQTVQPLLAIHDRVADNDLARQGVHDEVGDAMTQAQVAYCKATNNWAEGEKLLVLAQSVAMGQRLRDQIAENIRIDQENAKSGNDWCAPGYWDLAPEVVAELEKARAHAASGNFDAALDILLAMDKRIGFPLIRCTAHSMSVKAIIKYNEALGDYQSISPMVKKIMGKLPNRWNLPTPETPDYLNPPCLACGSKDYTRWRTLTHDGNRIFMCSSCADKDDEEDARRKRKIVQVLSDILDYFALAAKLDPQDPGIRRNKGSITKDAVEFGHSGNGDANALAGKLTKHRVRRTAVEVHGNATDTCFFCGQHAGNVADSIFVPMHGPVTRVEFLLGSGTEYQYGDVVVPRCAQCKQHHAMWPERIEAWHVEALRAGDESNFPVIVDALDQAVRDAAAANVDVVKSQDDKNFPIEVGAISQAMASLESQQKLSESGKRSVAQAEAAFRRATEAQGFLDRLFRRSNPARDAAVTFLEAAKNQNALTQNLEQQANAVRVRMQNELLQAKIDAKAIAANRILICQQAIQGQIQNLQLARESAVATYKAANPQPVLPEGVRQEADLMHAPAIAEMLRMSWSLGDQVPKKGGSETNPNPKGTVNRSPVLQEMPRSGTAH